MGTSTEVAGYLSNLPFFFRRARVYLTSSPPSAPLLRARLLGATALRSALLDREQDRLRVAGLSPQYGAQTQDGTDVQVQSGTPFAPSLPLHSFFFFPPFRRRAHFLFVLIFPQFAGGGHATNMYLSGHRRRYMKTAMY
jgi:hypothetical protein